MVLEDIYAPKAKSDLLTSRSRGLDAMLAAPIDRLAANVADLVLFLPVLTLILAPFSRVAKEAQILGNDESWALTILAAAGAGFLALLLYQTLFVCLFGGTPGKLALRLRVVSIWRPLDSAENRPRSLEAFLRALIWSFELCLLGVPWLAIFSNGKRRPFHDRIADTAVIALASRRQAGPPSLAEMSMASGFQSAALAVVALVASVNITQYRRHLASVSAQVTKQEADGRLCPEIREAIEESSGGKASSIPDRLQTALSLHAVDGLDTNCLDSEAEFALWKNESRGLAYLARGIANDDDTVAEKYFTKACESAKADGEAQTKEICAMAELSSLEDETEDRAGELSEEQRFEKSVRDVSAESPVYLRVKAFRALLENRDYARAMPLIEKASGSRKVASFISKERAKALWSLGRRAEAHTSMIGMVDLVDTSTRVDLSRWFCFNETFRDGCSTESRKSCELLTEAVDRFDGWLLKPDVATAFIRAQTCADEVDFKKLEERLPSNDAKAYVRALSQIARGETEGAAVGLRQIVDTNTARNAYYLEASSKLVELARSPQELRSVETAWAAIDSKDEIWRPLALSLQRKLISLHAWEKSLALGLKIVKSDPSNRAAFELMVVAANGSGQKKIALGFLESALRLSRSGSPSRVPASEGSFDEVARSLLSREGAR